MRSNCCQQNSKILTTNKKFDWMVLKGYILYKLMSIVVSDLLCYMKINFWLIFMNKIYYLNPLKFSITNHQCKLVETAHNHPSLYCKAGWRIFKTVPHAHLSFFLFSIFPGWAVGFSILFIIHNIKIWHNKQSKLLKS